MGSCYAIEKPNGVGCCILFSRQRDVHQWISLSIPGQSSINLNLGCGELRNFALRADREKYAVVDVYCIKSVR